MVSRVSKEDLRHEFYNDFLGIAPYEADVAVLSILIRESVLKVRKSKIPKRYQACPCKENFLKHCAWTTHLKNYPVITKAVLNKMVHDYYPLLVTGKYIIIHEPWYCGYRADIGIIPAADTKTENNLILAVELGDTQMGKVIECITTLPNLQAIWHVLDFDECFIWSKGRNWNKLKKILSKHSNCLDKLHQEKQQELKSRGADPWRLGL